MSVVIQLQITACIEYLGTHRQDWSVGIWTIWTFRTRLLDWLSKISLHIEHLISLKNGVGLGKCLIQFVSMSQIAASFLEINTFSCDKISQIYELKSNTQIHTIEKKLTIAEFFEQFWVSAVKQFGIWF